MPPRHQLQRIVSVRNRLRARSGDGCGPTDEIWRLRASQWRLLGWWAAESMIH